MKYSLIAECLKRVKTTPWLFILAMSACGLYKTAIANPENDDTQLDFIANPNPDYFIKKGYLVNYDDYNFDGLLDFQVLVSPNASFSLYYYYLWNEKKKKYEENAILSSMGDIVIDKIKKSITSIENSGQGNCIFKYNTYKYLNHTYKLVETLSQKFDKKNGVYIRTHNVLKTNGETSTTIANIAIENCRYSTLSPSSH